MRIVLFKVNHLGDNVVFLPVVQALRRMQPGWRLTVITARPEAPLYSAAVPPGRLWTSSNRLSFNHAWRRPWVWGRWLFRLRAERPDAILLSYDQSNSAHLLAKFSGARVRIGARMSFLKVEGSMTHEVARPPSRKIAKWNWEMGRVLHDALGGSGWSEEPPAPDLGHFLIDGRPPRERLIVIHSGARTAIRRWGADRMMEVGRRLAADGWRVAWVGRPDTSSRFAAPWVEIVESRTLAELATLLSRAALLLCNNSGPLHVANALGTPLVVVSGPSSYDWDPYWHPDRSAVLRMAGLECIACEDSGTGTDFCANQEHPLACMHHWTPESVAETCRALLVRTSLKPD